MADLSVTHRAALAQVVDTVPDGTLTMLAVAVSGMPGERARTLEAMLREAGLDRQRRARAFAALQPLFASRRDGVESLGFPSTVAPRLWKLALAREPDLAVLLDVEDPEADASRIRAVSARLYAAAAAAIRDEPERVWPPTLEPDRRDKCLDELAKCCDLAPLVTRAIPSLRTWIARPDADRVAEYRLVLRDASTVAPDGVERLLHMLFAHLADAALILRLLVHSSSAASREAFVHESELAVFVDRLMAAVEVRTTNIVAFRSGGSVDALEADLTWVASTLTEMNATMRLHPDSAWGRLARNVRGRIGKRLEALLVEATRLVDRALPEERVQTAGRMTRNAPKLDAPVGSDIVEAASDALDVVRTMRAAASAFGCEAQRQAAVTALTLQMTTYADQVIEEINDGDLVDETLAVDRAVLIGRFLERIEAVQECRTVRRRVAVAGGPAAAARVSPQAA